MYRPVHGNGRQAGSGFYTQVGLTKAVNGQVLAALHSAGAKAIDAVIVEPALEDAKRGENLIDDEDLDYFTVKVE